MSEHLFDVNVLLAAAWPSHEHHEAVHRWLATGRGKWASCSATQIAFIRLSANPQVVDPVATPAQAGRLLRKIAASDRHVFWIDDLDIAADAHWPPPWVTGYRQISDAHLVRLAKRHGGRVLTCDRALATIAGATAVGLIA